MSFDSEQPPSNRTNITKLLLILKPQSNSAIIFLPLFCREQLSPTKTHFYA